MSTDDQLHSTAIHSEAQRLARQGGRIDGALETLRGMAAGREDLLAEAAGLLGGYWTVHAATEAGWSPIAAGLLILAGPDRDLLQPWVDTGAGAGCRSGVCGRSLPAIRPIYDAAG